MYFLIIHLFIILFIYLKKCICQLNNNAWNKYSVEVYNYTSYDGRYLLEYDFEINSFQNDLNYIYLDNKK